MPKIPERLEKAKPRPPASNDSGVLWVPLQATILLSSEARPEKLVPKKIGVRSLGSLATHPRVGNDKRNPRPWILTHLPSSLVIVSLDTEEDVARVGQTLWNHPACRKALLMHRTKEALQRALPSWVQSWIRKCALLGRWCDPAPFSGGK